MSNEQEFKFPLAAELLSAAKEFYPDAAGKIYNFTVEERVMLDQLIEQKFQSLIPSIACTIKGQAEHGEVVFTIYRTTLTYDFYDYCSEKIALKLYHYFKRTDYTVQIIRTGHFNPQIEVRLYLVAPDTIQTVKVAPPLPEMKDPLRQTGRSTKQIMGAPQHATYVCMNSMELRFLKRIAEQNDRSDLQFSVVNEIFDAWGTSIPKPVDVVFDHAVSEFPQKIRR
jgi:hypothetical protein